MGVIVLSFGGACYANHLVFAQICDEQLHPCLCFFLVWPLCVIGRSLQANHLLVSSIMHHRKFRCMNLCERMSRKTDCRDDMWNGERCARSMEEAENVSSTRPCLSNSHFVGKLHFEYPPGTTFSSALVLHDAIFSFCTFDFPQTRAKIPKGYTKHPASNCWFNRQCITQRSKHSIDINHVC